VLFRERANALVPWLLRECEPEANGEWWVTHTARAGVLHAVSSIMHEGSKYSRVGARKSMGEALRSETGGFPDRTRGRADFQPSVLRFDG